MEMISQRSLRFRQAALHGLCGYLARPSSIRGTESKGEKTRAGERSASVRNRERPCSVALRATSQDQPAGDKPVNRPMHLWGNP